MTYVQDWETIPSPFGDELTDFETSRINMGYAVKRNRYWARRLGWIAQLDEILKLVDFHSFRPPRGPQEPVERFAEAVAHWQARHGLTADGILGPKTWRRMRSSLPSPTVAPGIQDRTAFGLMSRRGSLRPLSQINALVLHQMAFDRGNDLSRYNGVRAHFIILRDGKTAQLHPASNHVAASHGFNPRSVAVELAGNLADTRGRCWKGPPRHAFRCLRPTRAQISAGRNLVKHLIRTLGIKCIYAHRQSAGDRGKRSKPNDPGPDVWYCVGQWAVDHLGLSSGGPGYKIEGGLPIPSSWRTWNRCHELR